MKNLLALVVLLSGCAPVHHASCYVTTPGPSYRVRVHLCKALWDLDEALNKFSRGK